MDKLNEVERIAEQILPRLVQSQTGVTTDKESLAWKAFGYAGAFVLIREQIREGRGDIAKKFAQAYL